MNYKRSMISVLLRLLAAISLMVMPLAMGQAAPSGSPSHLVVEAGSCGEHQTPDTSPAGVDRHCAACVALPAIHPPATQTVLLAPDAPLSAKPDDFLLGREFEVATPPPKAV